MLGRRRLIVELVLLLWISTVHGRQFSRRVRTIGYTKGNDSANRGLTTIRGRKKPNISGMRHQSSSFEEPEHQEGGKGHPSDDKEPHNMDFEMTGTQTLSSDPPNHKPIHPDPKRSNRQSKLPKKNHSKSRGNKEKLGALKSSKHKINKKQQSSSSKDPDLLDKNAAKFIPPEPKQSSHQPKLPKKHHLKSKGNRGKLGPLKSGKHGTNKQQQSSSFEEPDLAEEDAINHPSDEPQRPKHKPMPPEPKLSSQQSKLPKKHHPKNKGNKGKLGALKSGKHDAKKQKYHSKSRGSKYKLGALKSASSLDAPGIAPASFDEGMMDAETPIPEDSVDETRSPTMPPTRVTTEPLFPTHLPTPEAEIPPSEDMSDRTKSPTTQPTQFETESPFPTSSPTIQPAKPIPTRSPTIQPTKAETKAPTRPSVSFDEPSLPTEEPTILETEPPATVAPTLAPTRTEITATEEKAVAAFQFEEGAVVTEPTATEIFRLEIATSAFYIGIFSDAYRNNPDTNFLNIVAEVEELLYSENATPPIQIEWNFLVGFDATSTVIPTSEEILELIYSDEETLQEYVEIYLHSEDDVWGSVSTVTYYDPSNSEESVVVDAPTDFPSVEVEASLMLEFSPGSVVKEPSQEEYERLVDALEAFYTALLSQTYTGTDDVALATVTTSLGDSSFTAQADASSVQADASSVQANLEFDVFFSEDTTNIPTSDSILDIMQETEASLLRFIQEDTSSAWVEGDAWDKVSNLTIEVLKPIQRTGGERKSKR